MVTGQVLDELLTADAPVPVSHPMDSSRILSGLMQLARQASTEEPDDDALDGVISAGVLRRLLSGMHFRDVGTVRHVRRVAQLSVGMAGYLGWDGRHLKVLEIAALLHDVGKIGVPDNILFKPSALSPDEADLMALHHSVGYNVLQACRVDPDVLKIVGHLHDPLNGRPNRNSHGVPMGSRILSVADAYDSLRTEQVYRGGLPHDEIMRTLLDRSGTQFDANVVRSLGRWMQESGVPPTSGELSVPTPTQTVDPLEASSLSHIFSYLYLIETLYDGFFIVGDDLRFVVWSCGAERLLGRSVSEMINGDWDSHTLSYADSQGIVRADADCPTRSVLQIGRPVIAEGRIQHHDGRWIDVETQTVPLLDESGRVHGVAEILRDRSRSCRRPTEYHALKMAASRDALTGVANRGELETSLSVLFKEAVRNDWSDPFAVIFLDVDYFKQINDTHGHTVGDRVLIEIARTVQQETYSGEVVGRYGGEEFVVLCPGTDLEQAVNKANRIRVSLSRMLIPELAGNLVSASFGVAEASPCDSVESLLRRADKALYQAKRTGRNRTCSLSIEETDEADTIVTQNELVDHPGQRLCTGVFTACIPADMLVYKLGGFVNDERARLLEVAPNRAVIRLGSRGVLPFWGNTDELRPIEIELLFGEPEAPRHVHGRMLRSSQVQVVAKARPIGWVRDPNVFEARARRVLKKICSYFASELHVR